MGKRYLIDTNTVIEYLNNKLDHSTAELIDEAQLNISVITRIELMGWPKVMPEEIELLQNFINSSIVFNLEEQVILQTIEIRKKYQVKLPDAIIAATAMVHHLELITRNIVDFRRIENLQILNPY